MIVLPIAFASSTRSARRARGASPLVLRAAVFFCSVLFYIDAEGIALRQPDTSPDAIHKLCSHPAGARRIVRGWGSRRPHSNADGHVHHHADVRLGGEEHDDERDDPAEHRLRSAER